MKVVLILSVVILSVESARILAVFPMPSISHQVVFRPLIHELVSRGHEIVVITPDPVYPNGGGPANLKEIDMHDIAYKPWVEYLPKEYVVTFNSKMTQLTPAETLRMVTIINNKVLELQLLSEPVQKLIKDKTQKFDLVLLEAILNPLLVFSHIFKAPVIQISSFGSLPINMEAVGASIHPILYPNNFNKNILNPTAYDKLTYVYDLAMYKNTIHSFEAEENQMLRHTVGPGIPTVSDLANNVDMLFLNIHPIWEHNRPVPPNVIFMGALHIQPEKELPKDLKTYLDSSKNGVIYMSFGTNVDPRMFPPKAISSIVKSFADLPYDVLWKWHTEDVPELPKNVKISKWFPQRDLLMHPNIKLFITQGGLQSTDETILAGVPVLGIPMIGDQFYNVDKYVQHGIGVRIDVVTINVEMFKIAINTVIDNKSYRENIIKLRTLMYDQPQTPLERAVWWTEYVLRHGGARHLRSPAANMSWTTYYEVELVLWALAFVVALVIVSVLVVYLLYRFVNNLLGDKKKLKIN